MDRVKMVIRMWSVTVDRYAFESSPMAKEYADRLVDMQVAASYQSLQETRDELRRIHTEVVEQAIKYEEDSKGFHRSAMYKGRSEAFMEFAHLIKREIEAYETRMEANKKNNGHTVEDRG